MSQAPSLYIVNNHAVRLLAQLLTLASDEARPISPAWVAKALACDLARSDPRGATDIAAALDRLGAALSVLAAELDEQSEAITEARYDLQDRRTKLSLSPTAGAGTSGGASSVPSLGALPPAVAEHTLTRFGRGNHSDARVFARMHADGDGDLAEALQAELDDRNAVAVENGSAAMGSLLVSKTVAAMSKPKPRYFVGNELDNHEVERLEVE